MSRCNSPLCQCKVIMSLFLQNENVIPLPVEAKEMEHASAQTEALHITFLSALIGFFIFAFVPRVMEIIYDWVPYIE